MSTNTNNQSTQNVYRFIESIDLQLFHLLMRYLRKYIFTTNEAELALLATYAIATYLYDLFPAFPILHIQGDFETGKGRRLELLSILCNVASILVTPSVSSLFRTIDETEGTILLDEADESLKDKLILNILLAGYKRGAYVTRSVRDSAHPKDFRPEKFAVYCPKVIVTRNGIDNDALHSRCITIITSPKPKDSEVPDILPAEAFSEGKDLKERIVGSVRQFKRKNHMEVNNDQA
ncbi:hypothetical protein MYX76_10580 [Desulfobacterota bacterium AH_259_B03_O07]|nr:hypothetical protein [Desulfobacterota bacterium AH_259_B03_O07]